MKNWNYIGKASGLVKAWYRDRIITKEGLKQSEVDRMQVEQLRKDLAELKRTKQTN